jgi:beta-aspartyl-peptidase (threonine type)
MKKLFGALLFTIMITNNSCQEPYSNEDQISTIGPLTLIIHGGAGTILRQNMTTELENEYRDKLKEALNAGYAILDAGGSSRDAVIASIIIMEDSPLFNAGKGAVFTSEGKNEMDAAVMDGNTGMAGAVAGIKVIKNPILAAIEVMENSPHVMMSGKGAETFAIEQGLETADSAYFYTQHRYDQLLRAKSRDAATGLHNSFTDTKFGTVGAVALDKSGNIFAGTSTGGTTNKKWGRIGDAPIIGAGTYAENATCGISCTGAGEYFIRSVVAHDVAAIMRYTGKSVRDAAEEVVMKKLVGKNGDGGLIALDRKGNFALTFNTPGMYRGYINEKGRAKVMIYKDEE